MHHIGRVCRDLDRSVKLSIHRLGGIIEKRFMEDGSPVLMLAVPSCCRLERFQSSQTMKIDGPTPGVAQGSDAPPASLVHLAAAVYSVKGLTSQLVCEGGKREVAPRSQHFQDTRSAQSAGYKVRFGFVRGSDGDLLKVARFDDESTETPRNDAVASGDRT